MDMEQLGRHIRTLRREKGYTQYALAKKAGLAAMYVGEIERGVKSPSLGSFIRLATALDVSTDYLLRFEMPAAEGLVARDLSEKLAPLTPKQRKAVSAIVDAYIANLD